MSNLETALRNALKKGDMSDPIFRRKVYESAANAMQRSLRENGEPSREAIDAQNKRLAAAIRTVEADLKSTSAAAPAPAAASAPPAASRREPEMGVPEPVFAPQRDDRAPEPSLYAEPRAETLHPAQAPKQARKKAGKSGAGKSGVRAPYAKLLTASVLVAFLGIGFFWVFTTDAFKSQEARDTSVPNPEKVLESESFEVRDPGTSNAPQTLNTAQDNDDGWVSLFSPNDPTTLGLVAGATAEMKTDPFGDYAHIVTPNDEAEVQIDVPLNIMRDAPGRTVQIGFIAHAEDDAPTQMSVTCDLGALGDCGRVRFNMGQAPQEYLFQVQIPADASASEQGTLKIVTDIENGTRAINLLEARARIIDN